MLEGGGGGGGGAGGAAGDVDLFMPKEFRAACSARLGSLLAPFVWGGIGGAGGGGGAVDGEELARSSGIEGGLRVAAPGRGGGGGAEGGSGLDIGLG